MAKLLQTLTLTPILFLLLAGAATTALSQSTSFYYDYRNSTGTTNLTFQGDAVLVQEIGGSHIRLTETKSNAVGRVLYPDPVHFWQFDGQFDFNTTFVFRITPETDRSPGEGIAFFIAPVGSIPPSDSAGGNLGIFGSTGNGQAVFAVEFDTFVNLWDPNYRHVGIDLGSRWSSNMTFAGDAIVGKYVSATIRYASATKVIGVAVSTETETEIKTFDVSLVCDLSGLLPQEVQVGLSASTGEEVAAHEIFAWNFTTTMVPTAAANKSMKQLIRQFA